MATIQKEAEAFKDTDFLTALEKAKILRHFKRFAENGYKFEDFHKSIYEHLHLHCGFIAHYNRQGFYSTYFEGNFAEFQSTIEHNLYYEPYRDINEAILKVIKEVQ